MVETWSKPMSYGRNFDHSSTLINFDHSSMTSMTYCWLSYNDLWSVVLHSMVSVPPFLNSQANNGLSMAWFGAFPGPGGLQQAAEMKTYNIGTHATYTYARVHWPCPARGHKSLPDATHRGVNGGAHSHTFALHVLGRPRDSTASASCTGRWVSEMSLAAVSCWCWGVTASRCCLPPQTVSAQASHAV